MAQATTPLFHSLYKQVFEDLRFGSGELHYEANSVISLYGSNEITRKDSQSVFNVIKSLRIIECRLSLPNSSNSSHCSSTEASKSFIGSLKSGSSLKQLFMGFGVS